MTLPTLPITRLTEEQLAALLRLPEQSFIDQSCPTGYPESGVLIDSDTLRQLVAAARRTDAAEAALADAERGLEYDMRCAAAAEATNAQLQQRLAVAKQQVVSVVEMHDATKDKLDEAKRDLDEARAKLELLPKLERLLGIDEGTPLFGAVRGLVIEREDARRGEEELEDQLAARTAEVEKLRAVVEAARLLAPRLSGGDVVGAPLALRAAIQRLRKAIASLPAKGTT